MEFLNAPTVKMGRKPVLFEPRAEDIECVGSKTIDMRRPGGAHSGVNLGSLKLFVNVRRESEKLMIDLPVADKKSATSGRGT